MVPYATNRHGRIALVYTVVYGMLAILFGFIGLHTLNLVGVGLALTAAEFMMAIYTIREALRLSDVRLRKWAKSVMQPPVHLVRQGLSALHNAIIIR